MQPKILWEEWVITPLNLLSGFLETAQGDPSGLWSQSTPGPSQQSCCPASQSPACDVAREFLPTQQQDLVSFSVNFISLLTGRPFFQPLNVPLHGSLAIESINWFPSFSFPLACQIGVIWKWWVHTVSFSMSLVKTDPSSFWWPLGRKTY